MATVEEKDLRIFPWKTIPCTASGCIEADSIHGSKKHMIKANSVHGGPHWPQQVGRSRHKPKLVQSEWSSEELLFLVDTTEET